MLKRFGKAARRALYGARARMMARHVLTPGGLGLAGRVALGAVDFVLDQLEERELRLAEYEQVAADLEALAARLSRAHAELMRRDDERAKREWN